ncbi:MAG: GrpB family protein, partial [Actinobacteria bacterium]|nr:GrpB family protein [Actinomycetota bacterium]
MSQTPIRLADYDPEWPERFEQEAARIREAAGDHLLALEHIGSTAVPGLAAKPVVDMLGGTETLADADACVGPLEAIGYEYVPELEAELPERRYFRRTADGRHT